MTAGVHVRSARTAWKPTAPATRPSAHSGILTADFTPIASYDSRSTSSGTSARVENATVRPARTRSIAQGKRVGAGVGEGTPGPTQVANSAGTPPASIV